MKTLDLFNYLNSLYPIDLSCSWDNSGFLVGDKNKKITSVLICLDITYDVLNEAILKGSNLIISHHPIIFEPIKKINEDNIVYSLIKNDISVISFHTNLDAGENGINDVLCRLLNLNNIYKLKHNANEAAFLRVGETSITDCNLVLNKIKNVLKSKILKTSRVRKDIKTIAVCGGSGSNFIPLVIENKIDLYLTSEIKHDKFIMANDNNIIVVDAGHFETEDIICGYLKNTLKEKFENLDVSIAVENKNPVLYI
ncbi:MAG: Nif3-like dinuclear metal center hexameric protein [Oscillospiraceae bacterium]